MFLIIVWPFLLALIAILIALRKRTLFISDAGTVIFAPLLFFGLGYLRPEFCIGFGLIVWPCITLVLGCLLFWLRVVILDRVLPHPRLNSLVLCITYIVIAILCGLFIPPLSE
jgi:hypothetical protein